MVEDSLVKGEVLGNVLKFAIELLSPEMRCKAPLS